MKLHYCDDAANFGDRLNLWMWDRLIPGYLDDNGATLFLGIGTILNDQLPRWPSKVVLGSGVGYGPPPAVDKRWRVYCVRGPLSARAMGLGADVAVTDPAALVRTLDVPGERKIYDASFMPHHWSARYADWEAVCRSVDIHYIDPRAPVQSVMAEIKRSKLILTEALHGAIVADAFRIPWIAVEAYHHINRFKWRDWCLSLDVPYRPASLTPLWDIARYGTQLTKVKLKIKLELHARGLRWNRWSPARPLKSSRADWDRAQAGLYALKSKGLPVLSRNCRLEPALSRLQETLHRFKTDWPKSQSRTTWRPDRTGLPDPLIAAARARLALASGEVAYLHSCEPAFALRASELMANEARR